MWNVVDSLDDDIDNFWFNSMGDRERERERPWSLHLAGVMRLDLSLVTTQTCRFSIAARQGGLYGID